MNAEFSFSNTANRTTEFKVAKIDTGVYATREDEPQSCTIVNTTTPIDQPEVLTFQCGTLKRVPSKIVNQYPAPVETGVQYGVRLDELLRVTSDGGEEMFDLPMTATITFRHPSNAAITAGTVELMLSRLIGALYKSDTETRINDMMRMAIRPQ